MNLFLRRAIQSICAVTVAAVLIACGSSTTVSPLRPDRVIGLGDAYNDVRMDAAKPYTVSGTGTVSTVLEQIAAYFGVGTAGIYVDASTYTATTFPTKGIFSYAMGDALVSGTGATDASLTEQVDRLLADVGNSFTDKDLILITIGTRDLKAGSNKVSTVTALMQQIDRLLRANAKFVLIMPPLDLASTPWGKSASFSSTSTTEFITEELNQLNDLIVPRGYARNPVMLVNASTLSSEFKTYASVATYSIFTTSTQTPACQTAPATMVGCALADAPNHATSLFADNLNLTPAGNRWVAQYLYSATAHGWR